MLAGGGAPEAVDANGNAAGAGNESNLTRTRRCSNLLSVKNFALGGKV